MKLTVERRIRAPGVHLCGLAWDGQALWHSDADTGILYKIDPETEEILQEIGLPYIRTGLSYEGGYLWQVAGYPKRVVKIDPDTGQAVGEFELGLHSEAVCGVLVEGDSYWIGPERDDWIVRFSRGSQEKIGQFGPVPSGDGLCLIGERLWYSSYRAQELVAISTRSGEEVVRYLLPEAPTDLCYDGEVFWLNCFSASEIWAIRIASD